MTAEEARMIAAEIARLAPEVNSKWALLHAWGPAVAVPVVCLLGLAFAVWTAAPRLLEWIDEREAKQNEREDKIREAYLSSMRDMTAELKDAISHGCAYREPFADDDTAKFRRRVV